MVRIQSGPLLLKRPPSAYIDVQVPVEEKNVSKSTKGIPVNNNDDIDEDEDEGEEEKEGENTWTETQHFQL